MDTYNLNVSPTTQRNLKNIKYDSTHTLLDQPADIPFGPMSTPIDDFMHLPSTCKVEWIGLKSDIPKLEKLLDMEFIGVDSEWIPNLHHLDPSRVALM